MMDKGTIESDRSVKTPVNWSNCEEVGGFKIVDFPKSIPRGRRSPVPLELSWLHNELIKHNKLSRIENVLEYSGGITTWTTYDAIKPFKYICVEKERFSNIFGPVKDIYPEIEVVHSWFDIPDMRYDLVFIDGSSCIPDELKEEYGVRGSVCRMEALMYSERYMDPGCLVVHHDWGNPKGGWYKLKKYLFNSDDYEFLRAFKYYRKGFGIFRKVR